jgi:hypothetical protein
MIALLGRSALYFTGKEFFKRSGEHYRKLDARQKTGRTLVSRIFLILKKCAMCGFGTHTL